MDGFLWYLATPYTIYDKGLDQAAADASRLAALLMVQGYHVFSPIAHCHYISDYLPVSKTDGPYWFEINRPYMDRCDGILIGMMPGWLESTGIAQEREYMKGCPELFATYPTGEVHGLPPDGE